MNKRTAIAELTDALDILLDAGNFQKVVLLSGAGGATIQLFIGWVVDAKTRDRDGPFVFLIRHLAGLTDRQRARALLCFARIHRRPHDMGDPRKPDRGWSLNLQADPGIAAEAAVGLFREIFEPLDDDYRVTVEPIKGRPVTVSLADDGRPRRPARTGADAGPEDPTPFRG